MTVGHSYCGSFQKREGLAHVLVWFQNWADSKTCVRLRYKLFA